jgi:hypothetical protein
MIHKFEARKAPRVFLLPAIPVVIVTGSILILILWQPLLGAIALAMSAWVSFHLVRYTTYQFKSHVRVSDDELVCVTSMGVESVMQWTAITHAGSFATDRAGVYLFVYDEKADELLSIPPFYTDRDQLEARIRENVGSFLELSGSRPDDLGKVLKPLLSSEAEESESSSTTQ